ncbi:MAG TPA: STAS domain-containing protein [Solirubrobacterales bacterium]|nr:STAS domain-containing protein [Solirubrobacterales bacterium]
MAIIPFRVEVEVEPDGVHTISVRGELDLNTAPELERPLEQALADPDARILLDLSGCEFIDSTGVALVVRSWQRHDAAAAGNGNGGRLVLCCPGAQVRKLLEITGVGQTIPTHHDRNGALADLNG